MIADHEHTPDTARVRMAYIQASEGDSASPEESGPQFDRWIAIVVAAAEQRGVAKALLKAADAIRENRLPSGNEHTELCDNCAIAAADHLLDRADLLEGDNS